MVWRRRLLVTTVWSMGLLAAVFGQGKVTLRGVILDPMGAVVTSALVTLYSADRILITHSRDNGRFQFLDLPPGRYTIEVESPGFVTRIMEGVVVSGRDPKPLSIELQVAEVGPCGPFSSALYVKDNPHKINLAGVVRYLSGPPIPKVRLAISRHDDPAVLTIQTSNEQGEFDFQSLQPGRYILTASLEGYAEQRTVPFWIVRDTLTRVRITMLKTGEMLICE